MLKCIVRTKVDTLIQSIPAVPHTKNKLFKALKTEFANEMKEFKFTEVKDVNIISELVKMEDRMLIKHYSFGVVYCKAGQHTDDEIFSNKDEDTSSAYTDFLNFIGDRVKLEGFPGPKVGLDTKSKLLSAPNPRLTRQPTLPAHTLIILALLASILFITWLHCSLILNWTHSSWKRSAISETMWSASSFWMVMTPLTLVGSQPSSHMYLQWYSISKTKTRDHDISLPCRTNQVYASMDLPIPTLPGSSETRLENSYCPSVRNKIDRSGLTCSNQRWTCCLLCPWIRSNENETHVVSWNCKQVHGG